MSCCGGGIILGGGKCCDGGAGTCIPLGFQALITPNGQTIPVTGVPTPVIFATEVFDLPPPGFYTAAGWVPPGQGVQLALSLTCLLVAGDVFNAVILKNGVPFWIGSTVTAVSGAPHTSHVSAIDGASGLDTYTAGGIIFGVAGSRIVVDTPGLSIFAGAGTAILCASTPPPPPP